MTTPRVKSLLAKNLEYVETLHTPPPLLMQGIIKQRALGATGTVIISCSDPRIPPEKFLNLDFSECAIIRNAGGRTRDVLRSVLALDAVGTVGTIVVVHHTDCGMSHTDEAGFQAKTEARHPEIAASHPRFVYGALSDPEKTVTEDVALLKSYSSLGEKMDIVGLVLDTYTGLVKQVV